MTYFDLNRELIWQRERLQRQGLSLEEQSYALAKRTLELLFGNRWVSAYLTHQQRIFFPYGCVSEAEKLSGRATIVEFAVYVLSLKYSDEFAFWCKKVRRGKLKLEAAYAEAQVAFWFHQHCFRPEVMRETKMGEKSCDLLVHRDDLDSPLNVEVTRLTGSPQIDREALLYRLRKKRKQLPNHSTNNIICINVPRDWFSDESRLQSIAAEFLKRPSSEHIDRVVLFADRWIVENREILRTVVFREVLNPKIYPVVLNDNIIGAFSTVPGNSIERFIPSPDEFRHQLIARVDDLFFHNPSHNGADVPESRPPPILHSRDELVDWDLKEGLTLLLEWRLDHLEGLEVGGFTLRLRGSDIYHFSVGAARQSALGQDLPRYKFHLRQESDGQFLSGWHSFVPLGTKSRVVVTIRKIGSNLHVRMITKELDIEYGPKVSDCFGGVAVLLIFGGTSTINQLGFNWLKTVLYPSIIDQEEATNFLNFDPAWPKQDLSKYPDAVERTNGQK